MSNNVKSIDEYINPLRLTDNSTETVYELDFSRESVKFAEGRGFKIEDLTDYPVTKIPEFFYYSFRKNHRNIAKSQTDDLLEKMNGLTTQALERLIQLYAQAGYYTLIHREDESEKNSVVTLEI